MYKIHQLNFVYLFLLSFLLFHFIHNQLQSFLWTFILSRWNLLALLSRSLLPSWLRSILSYSLPPLLSYSPTLIPFCLLPLHVVLASFKNVLNSDSNSTVACVACGLGAPAAQAAAAVGAAVEIEIKSRIWLNMATAMLDAPLETRHKLPCLTRRQLRPQSLSQSESGSLTCTSASTVATASAAAGAAAAAINGLIALIIVVAI